MPLNTAILAYSTTTGSTPIDSRPLEVRLAEEPIQESFCFVCLRCTDHFGEHDDLVDAGRAAYDTVSGNVYRVDPR